MEAEELYWLHYIVGEDETPRKAEVERPAFLAYKGLNKFEFELKQVKNDDISFCIPEIKE